MKIIIIGSGGFIGSNAKAHFSELGFEVWGCGVSESFEDNYFLVNRSHPDYDTIFRLYQFDVCINASGSSGVGFSFDQPFDDFNMNVSNVYALLNSIRKYNPLCKFVNLSSAAVYGNPVNLPIKEAANLAPLSPYGYHKLLAEKIVEEFQKLFNIQTCSFRIFSAYGPGLRKQLFWDIYQRTRSKSVDTVQLFGKGDETRDFIYIKDLLDMLTVFLDKGLFDGSVYNLGSGTETTISEAAKIFLKIIDPRLSVTFNQVQKSGDPLYWKSDVGKLREFKFRPSTTLEEGLFFYYEWLKEKENE